MRMFKPSEKEELCSRLMNAIFWSNTEGVRRAVNDGADVDKIYKKNFMPYEFIYDIPGLETPMFLAVKVAAAVLLKRQQSESISELWREKKSVARTREDALQVIQILIESGADLKEKDVFRVSLTEMTARMGDRIVSQMLMNAGGPHVTFGRDDKIGYPVPFLR